MSVPADLMQVIAGGAGEKAAPGPSPISAASASNTPPAGGPMSTPQPKEGVVQAAMVNISLVFQLLEHSLPAFGSQSEQGKAILTALKTLTGQFGKDRSKADSLIPAELQQLVQSVAGAGGGSPVSKAVGGAPPTQPLTPGGTT